MADNVKGIVAATFGVLMPKVLAGALNAGLDDDDLDAADMPMPPEAQSMLNDRLAQVTTQTLMKKLFGA
jgi:hypothetical protein